MKILRATFVSYCDYEITEEQAKEIEDDECEKWIGEIIPDFEEIAKANLELDDYQILDDNDRI